jgi:predicted transposase YbfD/YdcC
MSVAHPLDFRCHFFNLQDPRDTARTDFRLLDLIFIALCASIAGSDDWEQIALWAAKRRDWLARFCRLPPGNRTPSADTLRRLFGRLCPRAFARCFRRWTVALGEGLGLQQIAIDGKTLRGSAQGDGTPALHLVSAWAVDNHLSLGQVAVDQKSNEITALPQLLELLELKGALVTLDAMGCQKRVAQAIVDQGGDYALVVKANQGHLYEDIRRTFAYAWGMELDPLFRFDHHCEDNRGHGRWERRDYVILSDLGLIRDRQEWAGLAVIGQCVHEREIDGRVSREVRYFIGSRAASARE